MSRKKDKRSTPHHRGKSKATKRKLRYNHDGHDEEKSVSSSEYLTGGRARKKPNQKRKTSAEHVWANVSPRKAASKPYASRHSYGEAGKHSRRDTGKTYRGIVSAHPNGIGFVAVEGREKDIFLPREEMHQVMHGDEVMVKLSYRRGRESGELLRVVKQVSPILVAQLFHRGGVMIAEPRNKRFSQSIWVNSKVTQGAKDGDWVRIELERGSSPLRAKVLDVLGDTLAPTDLVELVIAEQQLPSAFAKPVCKESEAIAEKLSAKDVAGREDLQHLPFVTIDGEDARDFDDAICIKPRGEGFEAWVAIADVAHYVKVDSPLDKEARERGNSFYFPDRVIPMLPEKLSNGLCSLNPHVPRLAMVVRMRFDAVGKRRAIQVYNAVICSQARLTYTQVSQWLDDDDTKAIADERIRNMLQDAQRLYAVLRRKRELRGALDLELPEVRAVVCDGQLQGMCLQERHTSHMLIEELMLAANTAVVEYMEARNGLFLYRVHPEPEREAIEKLNEYLAPQGTFIALQSKKRMQEKKKAYQGRHKHVHSHVDPRDVQAVLASSRDKPYAHVLHRLVLRSMQKACYTSHKQGHFGLAYQAYGHFTSPIRRYADLSVHRCLKAILHKNHSLGQQMQQDELETLATHLSKQERKQQRAEWDIQAMLAALFHQHDVGKKMKAVVSGLTGNRIFMELEETLAEASCAVADLAAVYELDEQGHCLIARRSGHRIQLGDTVDVVLESTDPVRGQIIASLQ